MPFINIATFFVLAATIIVIFAKVGIAFRDFLGIEGNVYDNNALKAILLLTYMLIGVPICFMIIFMAGASIWMVEQGEWILPEFLSNIIHLFN